MGSIVVPEFISPLCDILATILKPQKVTPGTLPAIQRGYNAALFVLTLFVQLLAFPCLLKITAKNQ
jgi:hypothetical protein